MESEDQSGLEPQTNRRASTEQPRIPEQGTAACRDFFLAYVQINSFLAFVIRNACLVDHSAEVIHRTHIILAPEKRSNLEALWARRESSVELIRDQRQFLLEIVLVRHVENYHNYLSSLLLEIFVQKPETLRSSDKIEVEEVLRHSSVEAIVRMVAERKVESLSYRSFSDLKAFFADRFSLELVPEEHYKTVAHAIELRHLSAHNRFIVDRRFHSRTGDTTTPVGERKELFLQYLESLLPVLVGSVRAVDSRASSHLALTTVRFEIREDSLNEMLGMWES